MDLPYFIRYPSTTIGLPYGSIKRLWCWYAKEPCEVSYSRIDRYCSVLSPLDDIDFNSYRPYLQFTIVIKSGNLWSSKLTKKQKKNYQVVKTLRKEGLTYKQISNKMNEMGLSPIRTNKFSPSIVHSLEKKMEKRINRLTRVSQPTLGEMKLVFESDYFN